MTLTEQRVLFTTCLGKLLVYAAAQGIVVAIDQVKRMQAEADANAASGAGIKNSLHLLGLAADILCYHKEAAGLTYLSLGTEPEYATLAAYWKTLDPTCCWGGDFTRPDYDHYSSSRGGVK